MRTDDVGIDCEAIETNEECLSHTAFGVSDIIGCHAAWAPPNPLVFLSLPLTRETGTAIAHQEGSNHG